MYLVLFKRYLRAAHGLGAVLPYLHVAGVFPRLGLEVEVELVVVVTLGHVGHLEAADALLPVLFQREQVEDVLDVAYAVHMAIDVDVAVFGSQRGGRPFGVHLDARGLADGAGRVADVLRDASPVHFQQVDGPPGVHVYHGPHRARIAQGMPVLVQDGEVAVGEEAVDILHPCLHRERLVLAGHLGHLDGQAREHPGVVLFVQRGHAEAAFLGVEAGAVQQVVAQHAQGEPSRKVCVKRFHHKRIGPYLLIGCIHDCCSLD